MSARGVVAAGHPLTAEAGRGCCARAATRSTPRSAAVLTSFVTESPLTGPRRRRLHARPQRRRDVVLDFFVAVPGADGTERGSELVPIPVYFTSESAQVFHVGAASCGVPGRRPGSSEALRAVRLGAAGRAGGAGGGSPARASRSTPSRPTSCDPGADPDPLPRGRRRSTRRRACSARGRVVPLPRISPTRSSGSGPRGRSRSTAARSRGGDLRLGDSTAAARSGAPTSRPMSRSRASRCGRVPRPRGAHQPAAVLGRDPDRLRARAARAPRPDGLEDQVEGRWRRRRSGAPRTSSRRLYVDRFEPLPRPGAGAGRLAGRRPTSPRVDADGRCASVTCSNGTGSGLLVPGTGVHVNNMLGEEDLNPLGFHRQPPGGGCRR